MYSKISRFIGKWVKRKNVRNTQRYSCDVPIKMAQPPTSGGYNYISNIEGSSNWEWSTTPETQSTKPKFNTLDEELNYHLSRLSDEFDTQMMDYSHSKVEQLLKDNKVYDSWSSKLIENTFGKLTFNEALTIYLYTRDELYSAFNKYTTKYSDTHDQIDEWYFFRTTFKCKRKM